MMDYYSMMMPDRKRVTVYVVAAGTFLMIVSVVLMEDMVAYSLASRQAATELLFDIDLRANRWRQRPNASSAHDAWWRRPEEEGGGPVPLHSCRGGSSSSSSSSSEQQQATTRFAIVSMLSIDDSQHHFYTQSAAKLAKSARLWLPVERMDLVMLLTDGFGVTEEQDPAKAAATARMLLEAGWNVLCRVPVIEHPKPTVASRFHDAKMYSKLNVWALTEYEAVLFLDADTLIIREPTRLFTQHLPAMLRNGVSLAAVSDRPAKLSHFFNAGVMLLIPGSRGDETLAELKRGITEVAHDEEQTEQGLLNVVYAHKFRALPYIYNANLVSKLVEAGLWRENQDRISILHFTVSKGWQSFRNFDSLWLPQPFLCWHWKTDDLCQLWDMF